MESEVLFYDEMIVEDFHEEIKESKSTVQSENIKKYYKLNISKNNSFMTDDKESRISACSNLCLPTFVNSIDQSVYTDTLSVTSESSVESCSGSSLQQYDSGNDSDTLEEEASSNNETFDNEILQNLSNQQENNLPLNTLKNLKAAIQIKWLDRAMNIKKIVQQKPLNGTDNFNQKSKYRFYGKLFSLTETLSTVVEMQLNFQISDIQYDITEDQLHSNFIAVTTEIRPENVIILYKPILLSNLIENIRRAPKFILLKPNLSKHMSVKKRKGLIRSKSDIIHQHSTEFSKFIRENSGKLYENDEGEMEIVKMKNKNLLMEVEHKNKYIGEYKSSYIHLKVQLGQMNGKLHMAHEMIQNFQSNLFIANNTIEKLKRENLEIRKENEHMRAIKENAENIIYNEQQNKEILEKKIESYSAIENEYQWLCKAFVDYKNLCQDYDHLHISFTDMENQLGKVSQSCEESNYRIKYLENEITKYQEQIEKLSQNNQNHNNGFHCQAPCQCSCLSRPKSSHSKYKTRKKSKKSSNHYYESEEDARYIPKPIENEIKNSPEKSYNHEIIPIESKLDIKEIEKHYDDLQIKKRKLESELCHVPLTGSSSRRGSNAATMGDKDIIENELDKIDHELSSIRRTLKQFKVMGDR